MVWLIGLSHLWDCQASNGEARDDIRPQKIEAITWAPLKNREEELKTQNKFPNPCLVLESVKWVIWEEDLRDPVSEFLESGLVWRQTHPVQFQWWWHCHCGLWA